MRKQCRQRLRIQRRVCNVPGPNGLCYVAFFGYKGRYQFRFFSARKRSICHLVRIVFVGSIEWISIQHSEVYSGKAEHKRNIPMSNAFFD